MSHPKPQRAVTRSRRWRPTSLLLAVALALVTLTGGTALALFSERAISTIGTIRAGDLNLTLDELTWRQVTPGVNPGAVGTATTAPAGFRSMPGDIFEIRVPAITLLQGDNLVADLTVEYLPGQSDHPITATYHVDDPADQQVAPASGEAAVGTSVDVSGLLGDNAGVTTQFTIVITVKVLGEYHWVTPATPDGSTSWSAGTVNAVLRQVRPAGGA